MTTLYTFKEELYINPLKPSLCTLTRKKFKQLQDYLTLNVFNKYKRLLKRRIIIKLKVLVLCYCFPYSI